DMYTTEAWVLHRSQGDPRTPQPGELVRESYDFGDLADEEVLIEPLYGSWEGNMGHAVARSPVDVCAQRGEDRVVLGNSGVVRVLRPGPSVEHLREGDICLFAAYGSYDKLGYGIKAHGYDCEGTVGLLAKRTKVPAHTLYSLPAESKHTLQQWAVFSLRYVTAWGNWRVAEACYRSQIKQEEMPSRVGWGWGGGTTFAGLDLARLEGGRATLVAGGDGKLAEARKRGIDVVDRRAFDGLSFDEKRYGADPAYRETYQNVEKAF